MGDISLPKLPGESLNMPDDAVSVFESGQPAQGPVAEHPQAGVVVVIVVVVVFLIHD